MNEDAAVEAVLESIDKRLEGIEFQVKATNGRVGKTELQLAVLETKYAMTWAFAAIIATAVSALIGWALAVWK